jgi:hypothetical protein
MKTILTKLIEANIVNNNPTPIAFCNGTVTII